MARLNNAFLTTANGRTLDENIRDLVEVKANTNHTGLLRNYYDEMDDYHRGAISRQDFKVSMTRQWDAFFFFAGRLTDAEQETLMKRLLGENAVLDSGVKKLLFVSSSPKNELGLQVDFEFKGIQQALQMGNNPIQLALPLFAVTIEDFMSSRYREKPYIIHFSGHGGETGLVFSDASNKSVLVPADLVTEIFKGGAASGTEIVFLNACYAAEQAAVISKNIPYVIGTTIEISDEAAILVSKNFYRFLAEGQSAADAFRNARSLLLTNFRNEISTFVLWKSGQRLNEQPAN